MMYANFILPIILLIHPVISSGTCSTKLPSGSNLTDIYIKTLKWKEPLVNSKNGAVNLQCPTGFLQNELKTNEITVSCNSGLFNNKYQYQDLLCRDEYHQGDTVKVIPSKELNSKLLKCLGNDSVVFAVERADNNKVLYKVCFDTRQWRARFSYKPSSSVKPLTTYPKRGEVVWGYSGFGGSTDERVRLSRGYVKASQQRRTTSTFTNYNQGKLYPYYFNRGHLTAFADFNEDIDQRATCQYINVVPQWEVLNKEYWTLIEREARDMLQTDTEHWEIYTGSYGRLPSPRGPVYLVPFFDNNGRFIKATLPVPKLIWKIVYNTKDRKKSRVFIGVNNPEFHTVQEIKDDYLVCKPIIREGKPIQGSEFKGFVYECPLEEFLVKLQSTEYVVA